VGLNKLYKSSIKDCFLKRKNLKEEKIIDVNFEVGKNEIMGILGPSGAGKSSILKILSMAVSRSGGKVEILGQSFDEP
jgi:ABC-2 type transport system ATP-binding protein